MPTNWKYIKKLLEKEFLCEKLRGHITYDLTDYRPAPWYQQHFIMKYDDEVLLEAKQPDRHWYSRGLVPEVDYSQCQMLAGQVTQVYSLDEYGLSHRTVERMTEYIVEQADRIRDHERGIFGVEDIMDDISDYLHCSIDACFKQGQDPFITALGILDRRCGKRRLQKLTGRNYQYARRPDWLRRIITLRLDAEGMSGESTKKADAQANFPDADASSGEAL